jgi:hypothetical protein
VNEPTTTEREAAIAFIARRHPSADVVVEGVADGYVVDTPDGSVLYLEARRRDAMNEGEHYVTWVVTFRGAEPVSAESFSSRACSTGKDAPSGG